MYAMGIHSLLTAGNATRYIVGIVKQNLVRIIQPEDSHTTLTGSCIAVYDSWSTANPTGRRKTRFVTRKQQVFIPLSILFI